MELRFSPIPEAMWGQRHRQRMQPSLKPPSPGQVRIRPAGDHGPLRVECSQRCCPLHRGSRGRGSCAAHGSESRARRSPPPRRGAGRGGDALAGRAPTAARAGAAARGRSSAGRGCGRGRSAAPLPCAPQGTCRCGPSSSVRRVRGRSHGGTGRSVTPSGGAHPPLRLQKSSRASTPVPSRRGAGVRGSRSGAVSGRASQAGGDIGRAEA